LSFKWRPTSIAWWSFGSCFCFLNLNICYSTTWPSLKLANLWYWTTYTTSPNMSWWSSD
jgi:hypothetical protein